MSELAIQDVKYVTDERGKRKEVLLSFRTWKSIINELIALREKQSILLGLQQACGEAKLQEKGKLPEQTLEGFLDEL